MIVRLRFHAKACLCSVLTSLLLGQGGELLARPGGSQGQAGNPPASTVVRTAAIADADPETATDPAPASKQPASKPSGRPAIDSAPHNPSQACPYSQPRKLTATDGAKPISTKQRLPLLTSNRTGVIQQVAGTTQGSDSSRAIAPYSGNAAGGQSNVQQELQKLYQRDGRAMPPMNLSQITVPSGPPAANREADGPGDNAQPPKNFFQRTFPGVGRWFHKSPPEATTHRPQPNYQAPGQMPPSGARQPPQQFAHPRQPNLVNSPRPGYFPGVQQPAPLSAPPMQIRPVQPSPVLIPAPNASASPQIANETPRLAAPSATSTTAPPQLAAPETVAESKDSPFSGLKLFPEDSSEPKVAASQPSSAHDDVDDDLKLDDEAPTPPPKLSAAEVSRNEQIKLLAERAGLNGFKGFCPVTLKNERKLVNAKPEYSSEYNSKVYTFASAESKIEFDLAPDHYVPVRDGRDVVQLVGGAVAAEGSLDHAAWFKGRLYLFASDESMEAFVSTPAKFAAAAATK